LDKKAREEDEEIGLVEVIKNIFGTHPHGRFKLTKPISRVVFYIFE